jgi:hypothetical protein
MTDIRTEASFEVATPPGEAWKALEELRVRAAGPDEWWLPGFECRAAEVEVEPETRLVVRKLDQPCAETLIAVTFEHVDTVTRIRVVQSGFDPAFVSGAGESFWIHSEHIAADFHLYFEAGVIARRAWLPWAPLGLGVSAEHYGLRVTKVRSGMWGERAGVQADDVLLTIAGAPVYTAYDLGVIERVVHLGEDVVGTWARAGERCEATAPV